MIRDFSFKNGNWIAIGNDQHERKPILVIPPGEKVTSIYCSWCGTQFASVDEFSARDAVHRHIEDCPKCEPIVRAKQRVAELEAEVARLSRKKK